MQIQVLENPQVQEWLEEKRSPNTRRTYENRIRKFFKYFNMTVEDFLKLDPRKQRHLALRFQNEQPEKNPNTIYSVLTALNSFLLYLDIPINWKRARIKPRLDLTSHVFSNGDLTKMFQVANTKEKAMLSLACSLGWEINGILNLKRKYLRKLIDRAKSTDQNYVYFKSVGQKTGALRLGVLNPLALEWLDKWLIESKDYTPRKRKHDREARINIVSEVFDMTAEGFNIMLRRLAKDAQLVTTGRIHFHKIRGWVMSGLSRSGFNEFQIKYLMGKAIPLTDMTYLQTLQQEIEDRYPEAYEHYLNLKPELPVKALTNLTKQMKQQAQELKEKTIEIEALKEKLSKIDNSRDSLGILLRRVEELEKSLSEDKR